MPSYQLSRGRVLGRWKLVQKLGSGGNGQVWLAEEAVTNRRAAIKVLMKQKLIAFSRFSDEVRVLKDNADVAGLLPIWDDAIPATFSIDGPHAWFAMPLAEPIAAAVSNLGMIRRAALFKELASTLAVLHGRGVTHRDLKPANIVWYEGRLCPVDFGLVDYPGKADLTGTREGIGPRSTIAPEVRRLGRDADPFPADVYSLAKCLWIVLTGRDEGFEGQYSGSGSLALRGLINDTVDSEDRYAHWGALDMLLMQATDHDPSLRPSMHQFQQRLTSWLQIARSWARSTAANWLSFQNQTFPLSVPRQAIWMDPKDIVAVLNVLGSTDSMNHMFYPNLGGMDLTSAVLASAAEPGCIELRSREDVTIVRPARLIFESFGRGPEWNYFRLETRTLEPSGVYKTRDPEAADEEVTEIPGYGYGPRAWWDEDSFRGNPLPDGSRVVARYFGGPFVFFQKSSGYNLKLRGGELDPYLAPHAKMSAGDFRKFIEECIRVVDGPAADSSAEE